MRHSQTHCSRPPCRQVAYNADRRRQLWEQTARDDLKELTELRALMKAEEDKAEAKRKESHKRGKEVSQSVSQSIKIAVVLFCCFYSALMVVMVVVGSVAGTRLEMAEVWWQGRGRRRGRG